MKVLILGGTQFIGRHVAEALLAAGHAVTVFNRGVTPDPLPAAVERLRGDRDGNLGALDGGRWDACVDTCGYFPRQVRASAERLRERVGRYLFVSAVRTYADPRHGPVRETDATLPPAADEVAEIDDATYGPLKVACEQALTHIFGGWATILRPQVVVGPHDTSARYAYWVQRAGAGGAMLVPGDGSDFVQVVDVRDLARFVVTVVERDLGGVFNLAGPRLTWREFVALLAPAAPVWVPAGLLAGLSFDELPLYRPAGSRHAALMDVSPARALACGLALTPPAATLADVRASLAGVPFEPALAPAREAALIAAARGRGKRSGVEAQ